MFVVLGGSSLSSDFEVVCVWHVVFFFFFVGGGVFLSQFARGLLGTGPPDPTLESASPSPPQGSIRHRFDIDSTSIDPVSMSIRCRIDAKSTPEEGRARRIRGSGPGGLCLISPSQLSV